MLLNENIGDIEKPDEMILLRMNFEDYFYIHQSFLLNIQDLDK